MKNRHGEYCPLIKKDCIELKCAWYSQVRGVNPNTGQEVDDYACAVAWLPVLLVENSQQQRQTGAAVETFRNEMVKTQHQVVSLVRDKDARVIQQDNTQTFKHISDQGGFGNA